MVSVAFNISCPLFKDVDIEITDELPLEVEANLTVSQIDGIANLVRIKMGDSIYIVDTDDFEQLSKAVLANVKAYQTSIQNSIIDDDYDGFDNEHHDCDDDEDD